MDEKKSINVKLSTVIFIFIIILLIVGIVYFFMQNNSLQYEKTNSEKEVSKLQNQLKQLEQTVSDEENEASNVIIDSKTIDNSTNNTNSTNTVNTTTSSNSSIEVGYEELVIVLDGKPYIMPIHRPDLGNIEEFGESGSYYYNKFEIDNIKSGVKAAYAVSLGTDPSSSIYFVMEDGSVRYLDNIGTFPNVTFTSKEKIPSSQNVVELKIEAGILYAITKDGNKIKIAEAMA